MIVKSNSSKQTNKIGIEFVNNLNPGDVLLLYGDLGAGKTTFVQGIAEGLGIKERIISPTFVLQRNHDVKFRGINKLNHIDLYRIDEPQKSDSLGLSDLFNEDKSITVIEWAERLEDFEPKKGYKIKINYVDDDKREIEIKKYE